jgi:hypothetical protein
VRPAQAFDLTVALEYSQGDEWRLQLWAAPTEVSNEVTSVSGPGRAGLRGRPGR